MRKRTLTIILIILAMATCAMAFACGDAVQVVETYELEAPKRFVDTCLVGENLDFSDFKLLVTENDGEPIEYEYGEEGFEFKGFDSDVEFEGEEVEQVLTVWFAGRPLEIEGITVTIQKKTIKSISLVQSSPKDTYFVGDSLNLSGLSISVTYQESIHAKETRAVTADMLVGTYNMSAVSGTPYSVFVSYGGRTTADAYSFSVVKAPRTTPPTLALVTAEPTTLSVTAYPDAMYAIMPAGTVDAPALDAENTWQTAAVFTELQPATEYIVFAYFTETSAKLAGETASAGFSATTTKNDQAKPIITVVSEFNNIVIAYEEGVTYTAVDAEGTPVVGTVDGENYVFAPVTPNTAYTITAYRAESATHNASETATLAYTTAKQQGAFSITDEYTYDASPVDLVYDITGIDSVPAEAVQLKYMSGEVELDAAPTDAGSYSVVLTYTGTDFEIDEETLAFTIQGAPLTITANAKSIAYGDTLPTLDYTHSELLSAADEALLTGELALNGYTGNAGTYDILLGTVAAKNYTITFVPATLIVSTRNATVSVVDSSLSKVYGEADALQYTVELLGDDVLTGSLGREAGEDVGLYMVNIGTLANANYNLVYAHTDTPKYLNITKKAVVITPDSLTKTFGEPDPTFTYRVEGLAFDDTISDISISFTRTTGETVLNKDVNTPPSQDTYTDLSYYNGYDISMVPNSFSSENYQLDTAHTAKLYITRKLIKINATPITQEYGAAEIDVSTAYTIASDTTLVDGTPLVGNLFRGTIATVPVTLSDSTVVSRLQVGTANITPDDPNSGLNSLNSINNPNYCIRVTNSTYTVAKKPLFIKPNPVNIIYGDADQTITYSHEGLVDGDTILGTLSRYNTNSGAGASSITLGDMVRLNTNYSVQLHADYKDVKYTIAKRVLTFSYSNLDNVTYKGQNAQATTLVTTATATGTGIEVIVDNIASRDTLQDVVAVNVGRGVMTSGVAIRGVGAYTINLSFKQMNATSSWGVNYSWDGVTGDATPTEDFVVNKATITITANNATSSVGGEGFSLDNIHYLVEGLQSGEGLLKTSATPNHVLSNCSCILTNSDYINTAGTYTDAIVVSYTVSTEAGSVAANYNIVTEAGDLTVE